MKHCKKCNVDVMSAHENCPLCGAYLETTTAKSQLAEQLDERFDSPTVNIVYKENFLKNKFSLLLLFALTICVILNVALSPSSLWSAYVAIGVVMLLVGIIYPITQKSKFKQILKLEIVLLTVLAICFELTVTKGQFTWFALLKILPWVYLAYVAICDFMIVFIRKKTSGYIATLAFGTLFAVAPQIALWIASAFGSKVTSYVAFSVFFASIANLVVILIVCNRQVKAEAERNFNL